MKKIISLLLCVVIAAAMAFCFAGCGTNEADVSSTDGSSSDNSSAAGSDLAYVKEKGKLVIGITEFEPMDYLDGENWIGFDADMAKLFAESLGVKAEFTVIDWDSKIMELDGKTIDCVWNGMTLVDEVKAAMETSKPYCNNAQVVVVPADKADKYKTAEDCKDLQFAVEKGSAGKKMAEANGFKFTEVEDQATAVMEVNGKTCDAAIIDSLMAAAMIGEGTGYEDLTYTVSLNSEEYGVGFRKGSDLCEKLNSFFDECKANGKMEEIAKKYGVQAALIK